MEELECTMTELRDVTTEQNGEIVELRRDVDERDQEIIMLKELINKQLQGR